jgi:hypothetical protein
MPGPSPSLTIITILDESTKLIIPFSSACYYFLHLQPKYSHELSVLTLNLCSSLNASDQISHLYKTTGKITVLYILIFRFFNRRWDDKIFSTQFNLLSLSFFLNAILICYCCSHLNFAIFLKDVLLTFTCILQFLCS